MDPKEVMKLIEKKFVECEVEQKDLNENYRPRLARFGRTTNLIKLILQGSAFIAHVAVPYMELAIEIKLITIPLFWSFYFGIEKMQDLINDLYCDKLHQERLNFINKKKELENGELRGND